MKNVHPARPHSPLPVRTSLGAIRPELWKNRSVRARVPTVQTALRHPGPHPLYCVLCSMPLSFPTSPIHLAL